MIENDTYFDSYLPLYYTVPDEWDSAKGFLSEELKKIANVVNNREIGFYLDEESLTGKQFIPSANQLADGGTSQQFRSVFRKVFIFPAGLTIGVNTIAHGLTIDVNFTLIQIFASGTDSVAFTGDNIPIVGYDATNIIVTSTKAYDRAIAVIEYIEEL
jgi:hypothetical protein